MIEPGSTFRRELYDVPDAGTDDEIMGQGQEKEDRHKSKLNGQDHGPFRRVRDRNTALMRQQRSREQEHADRGPDHHSESTGRGQKERRLVRNERLTLEYRHKYKGQEDRSPDPADRCDKMEPYEK